MTTKIDTRKIKHQWNVRIFVWDHDNPIKANQNKLWRLIRNQLNFKGWNWKLKSQQTIQ
jgi:hypothetical protein